MARFKPFVPIFSIFVFALTTWLLSNFELYPGSRTFIPFCLDLIAFSIFVLGVLSTFIYIFLSIFRKKIRLFFWNISLCALACLPILWILNITLPKNLPTGSEQLAFESEKWKGDAFTSQDPKGLTDRHKMLKDIVTRLLPGKSEEEILDMLGPPDDTDKDGRQNEWAYLLGGERDAISIDYEWLAIRFKDGYSNGYEIKTSR